jgi:alpha-amylase
VYDEGWLDQFFSALEREQAWLKTERFHDYVGMTRPLASVYLPCGSYEEMLEWSGGYFRNFFTKYPEANAMQQKMLRVSHQLQKVHSSEFIVQSATAKSLKGKKKSQLATRNSRLLQQAQQELYTGQCNCAYWHGVFGGLYLTHLRRAVYTHLINADALLNKALGQASSVMSVDADGDGQEELSLTTPTMQMVVDPAKGATVTEWSLYGPRINLLDTLSRRLEPYHEKLRAKQLTGVAASGQTPASIHDLLSVKEDNLAAYLIYDTHRRSAFLDYALQGMPTLQEVVRSTWAERQLWPSGPFQLEPSAPGARNTQSLDVTMVRAIGDGFLRKTIQLAMRQPIVTYRYAVDKLSVPVVGLEFNLALRDERYLARPQEFHRIDSFRVDEPGVGVSLELSMESPATLFVFPIETVSESEEGLERTYQGLALVCLWSLSGSRSWASSLKWTLRAM